MNKLPPILVVDDEETDVFFLKMAAKKAGILNEIFAAPNGRKAVDFLEERIRSAHEGSLPGLLILDIKMPIMDGFEVLNWIRDRAELQRLPIVVVTSSAQEPDKNKALQLGALDFRVKPGNIHELVVILRELQEKYLNK